MINILKSLVAIVFVSAIFWWGVEPLRFSSTIAISVIMLWAFTVVVCLVLFVTYVREFLERRK